MAIGEFSLIDKYFSAFDKGENIILGIGDDCALTTIAKNHCLAITTDTLNEGVHFFKHLNPYLLGYKSLVVNLSDLAAMGAKAAYFTLSLNMPQSDENFLQEFARGLYDCAHNNCNIKLIGGNTSQGHLSISISAYGMVKNNCALLRSNAKVGDYIVVTGDIGLPGLYVDAGYGYKHITQDDFNAIEYQVQCKENRCALMYELATNNLSCCAIDISDGLIGDLSHICDSSNVSAVLDVNKLPFDAMLDKFSLTFKEKVDYCLYGGCDYEVLFTCKAEDYDRVLATAFCHSTKLSVIGKVVSKQDQKIVCKLNDEIYQQDKQVFEHFYN